jgi:hypothetical protein
LIERGETIFREGETILRRLVTNWKREDKYFAGESINNVEGPKNQKRGKKSMGKRRDIFETEVPVWRAAKIQRIEEAIRKEGESRRSEGRRGKC